MTHWMVVVLCTVVAVAIGRSDARRRSRLKRTYADLGIGELTRATAHAKRKVRLSVGAFVVGSLFLVFLVAWFDDSTTREIAAGLGIVLVFCFSNLLSPLAH